MFTPDVLIIERQERGSFNIGKRLIGRIRGTRIIDRSQREFRNR